LTVSTFPKILRIHKLVTHILIAEVITTLVCLSFCHIGFAQVGSNASVANPNLAKKSEPTALPGVTTTIAEQIIKARPISSNIEIDKIIGDALSDKEKESLRAKLFLPINLNTASNDELGLFPRISRKMKHEFEECRPYTTIKQFQREIGKYVDNKEVARFEQYVLVPMDLNAASSEAFTSIPGMSCKMVYEFEEYRPYCSMEQFRREIGKCVDDNEVARL